MWRAMPSNSVPSSRVCARPRCSAVWLQSSFSMMSWFIGTRAMRRASASACSEQHVVGDDLEDQPDLRRLAGGDLVAGQQIALRALEPHAIDPHGGGGRAPDARRRIAEARALARDDHVGAQHHVGAAADAPALHRGDGRLLRVPELHVDVDEALHDAPVGDRVPRAARVAFGTRPGPRSAGLGRGRPVEPVAGAEGGPFGAQQDDARRRVGVGLRLWRLPARRAGPG